MPVTHTVTNQVPPLAGYNLFASDTAVANALEREGAGYATSNLEEFGAMLGGEPLQWGQTANVHTPILHTHDRYGHRIDQIEFHPTWDALLKLGIENGVHSLPWTDEQPSSQVVRAAMFIALSQVDAGVMCPISMTYSGVPALSASPELEAKWRPLLTSTETETSALCGMALTEKQGGSDVGANTTVATPLADGAYELTGHKWFCSHPVCEVFLVLARLPDAPPGSRGLSCFLLPRELADGSKNTMLIQRLKDKLGTRSLASGEVEFDRAWAQLLGEEGNGLLTILEMVNHTRLDCVLGSTGGMRRAISEAIHHASNRSAFGKTLIDQPLMRNVLADLCLEYEAAAAAALRLARAFGNEEESAFKRLATAVIKYYVCKVAPTVVTEALECHGGNGFVDEAPVARYYRDVQVNSTWEGSGNVIALDVLRAIAKERGSLDAMFNEIELGRGLDKGLDNAIDHVRSELKTVLGGGDPQYQARRLVEKLATVLQGSLLVRAADSDSNSSSVAEGFCSSRFNGQGRTFGTLPNGVDCMNIIERSRPTG